MALNFIKKLGRRGTEKGYKITCGLYSCSFCLKEIVRQLGAENKQKSCGCQRYTNFGGENNGMYGKRHTEESINKIKEARKKQIGEKSPNWNNGSSILLYLSEFNKELKQFILERDNYTCQCFDCEHTSIKLHIHHIDYDKQNNNQSNLITLCAKCHGKTNGKNKRQYYYRILSKHNNK